MNLALRRTVRPGVIVSRRSLLFSRSYASHVSEKALDEPYPQLPYVSAQLRPPLGWQDQQMRRNFGDTLHEHEELLSMWGPDVGVVSGPEGLRQLAVAAMGFLGFGLLCKYVLLPEMPAVRREYPFSGLVKELGGLEENMANSEGTIEED